MPGQPHHHNGSPADWLEDAAFLTVLFSAVAIIATIAVLMVAI
jgi:hypothetical protein